MKILILFVCLAVIIIVAGGCVKKEENIYDRMLRYMHEKYTDDKFVIDGPFGGGPGITSKEMFVFSEKYPEYQITVGYYQDDGEEYFTDNYLKYKYKEETEKYIYDMLYKIFNVDSIVSYNVPSVGYINDFTSETSFDEFIVSPGAGIGFTAVISEKYIIKDMESIVEEIKEYITENSLAMNVDICFANSADNYKEYIEIEYDEISKLHGIEILMDKNKNIVSCQWW